MGSFYTGDHAILTVTSVSTIPSPPFILHFAISCLCIAVDFFQNLSPSSFFAFPLMQWVFILLSLFISFTIFCINLHVFCKDEVYDG